MAASHYRKLTFNLIDIFMLSTLTKLKLKLDPHLPKNIFYLLQWKPFKNDEKCFLFHFESSFQSQHIKIFVLNFWSCRKNDLIRKIRLNSKFVTPQTAIPDRIFGTKWSNPVKLDRKRKVWYLFLRVYWQSLSSWRKTRQNMGKYLEGKIL